MTNPSDPSVPASVEETLKTRLAQIQARCSSATEGPWAWESVAEKSNEFVVGLAWRQDGTPICGEIDPPDDDAMTDTVIRRTEIGANESGHANFADAEFIAHARSDIPFLLSALLASETPQPWQPIETAPKDKNLLLRVGNVDQGFVQAIEIGRWIVGDPLIRGVRHRDMWRYRRSAPAFDETHQPTHWLPLPSPPETP